MTSVAESGAQSSDAKGLPAVPTSVSCVSLSSLSRRKILLSLVKAVHLPSGEIASRLACGGKPPFLPPFFFCCGASSPSSFSRAQGASSSGSISARGAAGSDDSSCIGVALRLHSYDVRSHSQVAPVTLKRTVVALALNSMLSNGKRSALYIVLDALLSEAASLA